MYFPDNVAGLTALTERISGFLRRCLSRRRRERTGLGKPSNAEAPHRIDGVSAFRDHGRRDRAPR
jgi:hypothetical protein